MKRSIKELAQEVIDIQHPDYVDMVELSDRFRQALKELRSHGFVFHHPIISLWIHKLSKVASQMSSYEVDYKKCKEIA